MAEYLDYADLVKQLPERTELEEQEYRRGFRDGWIQATNIMVGLMFLKDRQKVYDIMFDHWSADLLRWMRKADPYICDWPPLPQPIRCVYCGRVADSLDHVVPVSKGGTNDAENLVPSCRSCNSSKGAKSVDEWRPRKASHATNDATDLR